MTGGPGQGMAVSSEAAPAPAPALNTGLDEGRTRRLDGLDVARGIALVAMAAYHCTWDLGFLQLTPENLALTFPGRVAARAIAGSFLFVVGCSLVLAHERTIRPQAFLRRLGLVSGAAAVITVATFLAFPESFIFFGILHHIALASVLALPFLRAPIPIVLAGAGFALAAPAILGGPGFDARPLVFLGLGTSTPTTNDFVPVFPWFGLVLAGIAAARLGLPRLRAGAFARWRVKRPPSRALAWAGRHSLLVYLVHQPLLLALLYPVALALGPHPEAGVASFQTSFAQNCTGQSEDAGVCRAAAACVTARLKDAGLWAATMQNRLSPEERERAQGLSRACFEEARRGRR